MPAQEFGNFPAIVSSGGVEVGCSTFVVLGVRVGDCGTGA